MDSKEFIVVYHFYDVVGVHEFDTLEEAVRDLEGYISPGVIYQRVKATTHYVLPDGSTRDV